MLRFQLISTGSQLISTGRQLIANLKSPIFTPEDTIQFLQHTYELQFTERKTPSGIIIDGGSDWIALNYEFSKYVIESKDQNLEELKTWFNYTLLPAESFFHTGKTTTIIQAL